MDVLGESLSGTVTCDSPGGGPHVLGNRSCRGSGRELDVGRVCWLLLGDTEGQTSSDHPRAPKRGARGCGASRFGHWPPGKKLPTPAAKW